ncbi:diaminobutyrate acetyltransferase [Castellaniella defragrans]|uniref:diaminobutyrate acetyltransferase n=1 Tax=Castellaniella defragrans TaxID=75697 RepID=UPI0023F48D5B|nr:diaminobutyrate acetyltransferase [Castellaniella defragrans]
MTAGPTPDTGARLRPPARADGPALRDLVARCPPLDLNSVYLYLLLAEHFSDTCILAEDGDGLLGMATGYRPPGRDDTLFVWQVAVDPRARGRGLGLGMLLGLLSRRAPRPARWIETTVGPANRASRRLFSRLAARLGAPLGETALFDAALFGADAHEAEPLLRIGPLTPPVPGADRIP